MAAAAIPPRPEDVYGGGGSFSACLSRAIRHSSTTTQTQNANNNSSIATPTTTKVDNNVVPPQEDQLIDTSLQSTPDNQDGNNKNDDTQSLTQTPIKIPKAPSSIEYKTPQRRVPRWDSKSNPTSLTTTSNTSTNNNNSDEQLQQNDNDWSQHHISYNKLRSTLHYFSKRRSLLRTKLRSSNTTIAIDGINSGNNKGMSEEEFNICVNEFGSFAPFLNNNNSTNLSEEGGSLKNYDRAGKFMFCICFIMCIYVCVCVVQYKVSMFGLPPFDISAFV